MGLPTSFCLASLWGKSNLPSLSLIDDSAWRWVALQSVELTCSGTLTMFLVPRPNRSGPSLVLPIQRSSTSSAPTVRHKALTALLIPSISAGCAESLTACRFSILRTTELELRNVMRTTFRAVGCFEKRRIRHVAITFRCTFQGRFRLIRSAQKNLFQEPVPRTCSKNLFQEPDPRTCFSVLLPIDRGFPPMNVLFPRFRFPPFFKNRQLAGCICRLWPLPYWVAPAQSVLRRDTLP